ncbi:hypothetical protein D2E16_09020 [Streptococcus suis]|nr:hypothetical protein D2E16_09020 [Streptococcus suis]
MVLRHLGHGYLFSKSRRRVQLQHLTGFPFYNDNKMKESDAVWLAHKELYLFSELLARVQVRKHSSFLTKLQNKRKIET